MDKTLLGISDTILPTIFMHTDLFHNVKIRFNKSNPYWVIHLFCDLLEFLSICVQMRTHLQNNINKLLCSCTHLCNLRSIMLDHCTWYV